MHHGVVEGDRGRIVAVSTPFAQAPSATNAAYAASTAALEAVVLSLARELREQHVTANVVVVRSIRPDRPAGPTAEGKGGWTTPEEIAAAMLWLCSDEAGTITGARIPLDGRA